MSMGPAADAISPAHWVKSIFNEVVALPLSTSHIASLAACLLGQSCIAVGSTLNKTSTKDIQKEKNLSVQIFFSLLKNVGLCFPIRREAGPGSSAC